MCEINRIGWKFELCRKSIIIKLPRLRRVKRNIPTQAKAGLQIEAAGGRDRNGGLVKVAATAVVGEALLKIEAGVEARGAAVVQKGIANKLLGIDAGAEAVIAFFVVELELWHYVVIGFYAQAVQHIAAAELH